MKQMENLNTFTASAFFSEIQSSAIGLAKIHGKIGLVMKLEGSSITIWNVTDLFALQPEHYSTHNFPGIFALFPDGKSLAEFKYEPAYLTWYSKNNF